MGTVMKVIQALIFTLSFLLVVIFLYLLLANSSVMLGHEKSLTSVWKSFKLPTLTTAESSSTSSSSSSSSSSSHHRPVYPDLPGDSSNVLVITKYGKYLGIQQQILGREVSAFLGIPYALPPIGNQRFRKSIPLVPSKKSVNATQFGCKCIQLKKETPIFTDRSNGMCEDCLKVNVWTPAPLTPDDLNGKVRSLNLTGVKAKPVMVWIYGGGFFMGTSAFEETDGRVLATYGDVVVVTFDYRVGPLGFIDLESDRESGNQGLYDQANALKWVKDNIAHFGGDVNSITLFGESSGAISISLHMMSPISSKYFSRAILQSGSAFMTDAFYKRAESSVPEFVNLMGCMKKSPKKSSPRKQVEVNTTTRKPDVKKQKAETNEYDYDYGESDSASASASASNIEAIISERPIQGNKSDTNSRRKRQDYEDEDYEEDSTADESSALTAEYDIECLRGKSVEDIIRVTKRLHDKYFFAFPPTPGEDFIPTLPSAVVKSDIEEKRDIFTNIKQVLLGTNENAFSYMLYLAKKSIFGRRNVTVDINSVNVVRSLMEKDLHHLLQMPRFQVDFLINRQFSDLNTSRSEDYLSKLISVMSDMSFVCPVNELADVLTSIDKTVYMYQFTFRSPESPWASWFGSTLHDEIPLIFGLPLRFPLKYSGKDIDLSKRMIKTWSHFARTGESLAQLDIEWPAYSSANQTYIKLNSDYSQLDSKLSKKSCESFKLAFDLLS